MMDGKRKWECLDLEGSPVHHDCKGWDYMVLAQLRAKKITIATKLLHPFCIKSSPMITFLQKVISQVNIIKYVIPPKALTKTIIHVSVLKSTT